nr:G protein-coupled receptor [Proales similis]
MNSTASVSRDVITISIVTAWMEILSFYFTVVLQPIGLLLNLANLIVFSRKRLNKTNMGFLYRCQTLIDLVLVSYNLFVAGSIYLFGETFVYLSDFACRFGVFSRQAVVHFSSWMTVIITFDRFMFIRFASQFGKMKKRPSLLLIITLTIALVCLANSTNLAYSLQLTESTVANQTVTRRSCSSDLALRTVSNLTSVFLRTLAPMGVMVVLNAIMIHHIRQSKSRIRGGSSSKEQRRENAFARVVIIQDLIFFAINFPVAICYIVSNLLTFKLLAFEPVPRIMFSLAFQVSVLFSLFYQTFSFVSYFLFNRLFRNEVLLLLCPKLASVDLNTTARSAAFSVNRNLP